MEYLESETHFFPHEYKDPKEKIKAVRPKAGNFSLLDEISPLKTAMVRCSRPSLHRRGN